MRSRTSRLQQMILVALKREGPATVQQLAAKLHTLRPSVSRCVHLLRQRGHLDREEGYYGKFFLTDAGSALALLGVTTHHLTWDINIRHTESGTMLRHLKVQRRDGKGGISWDELQAVKTEALGPDALCIEMYPPDHAIVYNANMRHLWEVSASQLPEGIGWNLR